MGASRLWWKRFVEKVSFEPGMKRATCNGIPAAGNPRGWGQIPRYNRGMEPRMLRGHRFIFGDKLRIIRVLYY